MKDAAFVKMRDSVSFYKIDPDEYVLRKARSRWAGLYIISGLAGRELKNLKPMSSGLHSQLGDAVMTLKSVYPNSVI